MDIIVCDVLLQLLAKDAVDNVYLYGWAKLALYHSHRSLSRTETGNVCLLAVILEGFLNLLRVVSFLDCQCQLAINLIGVLK